MNIQKLNIKPLETYINELIQIPIQFEKEFETNRYNQTVLNLSSQELINYAGFFRAGLKSVKIKTINPIMISNHVNEKFWSSIEIYYKQKIMKTVVFLYAFVFIILKPQNGNSDKK